ncbi:hypothetical protein CLOM_g5078, partial [Closterium sp. NIES-68]
LWCLEEDETSGKGMESWMAQPPHAAQPCSHSQAPLDLATVRRWRIQRGMIGRPNGDQWKEHNTSSAIKTLSTKLDRA